MAIAIGISNDNLTLTHALIAATLGGAVMGDHCSPISDTTVLSASGARSTLDAHFKSQVPYAAIAGGIAAIAYLVAGITNSALPGIITVAALLTFVAILFKSMNASKVQ